MLMGFLLVHGTIAGDFRSAVKSLARQGRLEEAEDKNRKSASAASDIRAEAPSLHGDVHGDFGLRTIWFMDVGDIAIGWFIEIMENGDLLRFYGDLIGFYGDFMVIYCWFLMISWS